MRRLKDRSLVPPDDFRYTDPDTGTRTTERGYQTWIDTIKERRRANGLPIPLDLAAKAEDQLCGVIPPEWCDRDAGDVSSWVDTKFGWNDFTEGMQVFADWGTQGAPLVDVSESTRRAAICVSCPLNVYVQGCATCRKIANFLTGAVAKKKTPHAENLRACAVCHCSLQAMVWFPMDLLASRETPDRQAVRPDFCWVKQGGENYETNLSH